MLIIHANHMETGQFVHQCVKPIPRWHSQVVERGHRIDSRMAGHQPRGLWVDPLIRARRIAQPRTVGILLRVE